MGSSAATEEGDLVGAILDVLPGLLEEGRTDEVLAAVQALVARNEELEGRLATMVQRRFKNNEGVSANQLSLFLSALGQQQAITETEAALVDDRLLKRSEAAGERAKAKALAEGIAPKRRPLKKPLPEHLPRVVQVIDVPKEEQACPQCGDEREVSGHEVSEVLELEPAKLYVKHKIPR